MTITSIITHSSDVARTVDFYVRHLHAEVLEHADRRAVLDVASARLEILDTRASEPSTWQESDLHRGFRHIGFKVADVDAIVDGLKAESVPFRLEPIDVPWSGVKIAFFFDPDGMVVEVVERHLQYHEIHDAQAVAAECGLPTPGRPRFDHIGHSVANLEAAVERYRPLGFVHAGTLRVDGTEGDRIDFLRSGHTVLEIFSFLDDDTIAHPVNLAARGFVGVEFDQALPAGTFTDVGTLPDGRRVVADPDDLGVVEGRAQSCQRPSAANTDTTL